MARSISEEEIQLKKRARRRLVGAVVLVAAVAVILPMVLDTEPKQANQSVEIQIPSPDSGPYTPKVAPAAPATPTAPGKPAPGAAATPPAPEPKPSQALAPARDAASAPASEPKDEAAKSEAAAKQTAKPEQSAPAREATEQAKDAPKAAPNGKYVVQIAALADPAKAKQLQQKIAHGGLHSYTEVIKTAKGPVTRVRAGPYATRQAAEKARAHLKAAGFDGKVIPK